MKRSEETTDHQGAPPPHPTPERAARVRQTLLRIHREEEGLATAEYGIVMLATVPLLTRNVTPRAASCRGSWREKLPLACFFYGVLTLVTVPSPWSRHVRT